jgi:hypothetical protein
MLSVEQLEQLQVGATFIDSSFHLAVGSGEWGGRVKKLSVSNFKLIIKLVTVGCFLISELFFFSFYFHFSF